MQIALCARAFDFAGALLVDVPTPEFGDMRRRGNRIATLDGGAVVNDFGYSPADRIFTLRWRINEDEEATVRRLIALHDRLSVSTPEGLFECIVFSFTADAGVAVLVLHTTEILSE
jgi:hypothetical protein